MGAPNPKAQSFSVTVSGGPLVLYIKPAEVSPYLGTITPNLGSLMTTETQAVGGHSRRRYFGGPAVSVAAHSRSRTSGDKGIGPTLPGKNAWLERKVGTAPNVETLREQITFTGTFARLKQFCKDNAAIDFVLRSPWGEPFPIEESA